MNSDYDALRALYRAASVDEQPTHADRHVVRMGILAAAGIGVQAATASAVASIPGAAASIPSAAVGAAASIPSAAASVASAKGVVQLLLGGKFLGGLVVGAAIGTAVSATAYVVDPPKTSDRMSGVSTPSTSLRTSSGRSQQILPATPRLNPQPDPVEAPAQGVAQTEFEGSDSAPADAPARSVGVTEPVHVNDSARTNLGSAESTRMRASAKSRQGNVGADRLLEETEALAKVQAALDRKEPAVAMALLDQQRRDFSTGQLAEERAAAYVLALCAAGKRQQAEQARAKFLLAHANSPLAKRVSKSCEAP